MSVSLGGFVDNKNNAVFNSVRAQTLDTDNLQVSNPINNTNGVIKMVYDFAIDGGATAVTIVLGTLPQGAIVTRADVLGQTTLTSGGAATIDLNVAAANDLMAATAFGGFTATTWVATTADGAIGNFIAPAPAPTAALNVTMNINTAAITAGRFTLFIEFRQP